MELQFDPNSHPHMILMHSSIDRHPIFERYWRTVSFITSPEKPRLLLLQGSINYVRKLIKSNDHVLGFQGKMTWDLLLLCNGLGPVGTMRSDWKVASTDLREMRGEVVDSSSPGSS